MVEMEVQNVELICFTNYVLYEANMMSKWIPNSGSLQPQSLLRYWDQTSLCDRISARKQCDVLFLADQFFSQVGNSPFSAAIEFGRNTFIKRGYLGNPHF
jgi:hypothetical protein